MPGTEAVMFTDRTSTDRAAASPERRTAEPPRPPWDPPSEEGSTRSVTGRSSLTARHRPGARPLRDRDESDPERQAVELAQRGRMILDVSIADLEAAEAVHGAFHADHLALPQRLQRGAASPGSGSGPSWGPGRSKPPSISRRWWC